MIVYMQCCKCHHQEKAKPEVLMGNSVCPECGHTVTDMYMTPEGTPPDWWIEPEAPKIERDPSKKKTHLKVCLYTAPKHADCIGHGLTPEEVEKLK